MSNTQTNKLFILFVFLPFASVLWPCGIFQESDLAFFGIWFGAGVYAIVLGLNNSESLKISVLAGGFFLLAALGILGIFQNGLTALGGINEIREGTATFLALGILIIVGKQSNMQHLPQWLMPAVYGILTIACCNGWVHPRWKTYIFLDIAAFPLLASLPMYMAFRQSLTAFQYLWDTVYLAVFCFLLFYCDNVAATVACVCASIFVFLLPVAKKFIACLPRKDGWYIAGGLGFIAVMILVSQLFFPYLPLQLQSRTLLGIVSVSQYFDHFTFSKFFHLLFGYGWGSYQEFPVLNLFSIENFSMYADGNFKPNWEFLERNLLHSHNLILETLVSSGLVGVGLLLTIIYKMVENIDPSDWAGRFFVVNYLILLSAWFQTPPVLIFSLLAMVVVKEKTSYWVKVPRFAWIGCGVFLIVFSCVELWSSLSLNQHKYKTVQSFEEDALNFINAPAHSYDKWSTYKASNMIIGRFFQGLNKVTEIDIKYLPGVEKAIVCLAEDYLNSYQKRNVVSSVHIINMCNAFVSLSKVDVSSKSDFFKVFKATLIEHLYRFPMRADMAIGFLNLCFDKMENIKEVNEMADIILKVSPDHPVGLWFKWLSGLSLAINKKQSLEKTKQAVKLGLCRFMPVPKEILAMYAADGNDNHSTIQSAR